MRTKPLPEAFAYGIDIGKSVFHVVAVNREGAVIQRAKFARETLHSFFDLAPKALIGMEACPGSQWLARKLIGIGHDARIIPARFVKPYMKSNKTDTVDAAAIAEAVTKPTMRFVEARTAEQVDLAGAPPDPGPACRRTHRADESGAGFVHRIWAGHAGRCRWLSC